MRCFLLASLALSACAHRQVATLQSVDLNNDGCPDGEAVLVDLGALPNGTSTISVSIGANDQRRFSEQFRPVEGTQCLALFTVQWGETMPWDTMDLLVEGSGYDKWFRHEVTISPNDPTAEICLDDAWGRRDTELYLTAFVKRQGEDKPEYGMGNFRLPPYGPSSFTDQTLSIHFTEMAGLSAWSPVGEPSTTHTENLPVDFTFIGRYSPGLWTEVDPNWKFSWEKPECVPKTAKVAKGK